MKYWLQLTGYPPLRVNIWDCVSDVKWPTTQPLKHITSKSITTEAPDMLQITADTEACHGPHLLKASLK